jgi:hypothetical protein
MVKILYHGYSRWSESLIYIDFQAYKRYLLHPCIYKMINLFDINGFVKEPRIILSLGPFLWMNLFHIMGILREINDLLN